MTDLTYIDEIAGTRQIRLVHDEPIDIDGTEKPGNGETLSLADFCEINEFDATEIQMLADSLDAHGYCVLGGGAAAISTIYWVDA